MLDGYERPQWLFRHFLQFVDEQVKKCKVDTNGTEVFMVYNPLEPRDPLGRWVKENGGLSPERVVSEKPVVELEDIALDPKTPQAVLNELARTEYQFAHPYNPKRSRRSDEEARYDYMQDVWHYNVKVRCTAIEKGADEDALSECRYDDDHRIRAAVAHRTTDRRSLDVLSQDEKWEVRGTVANNPSTPKEAVERLLTDDCMLVRQQALARSDLPSERLAQAVRDAKAMDAGEVETMSRTIENMLGGEDGASKEDLVSKTLESVAANPNADADTLHECMKDRNPRTRLHVAKHEHTSPEDLRTLAFDDSDSVRELVAANPRTPGDMLDVLADASRHSIRAEVASNPNTSPRTLDGLYSMAEPSMKVRLAVVDNPHTPTETLKRARSDSEKTVRSVVYLRLRQRGERPIDGPIRINPPVADTATDSASDMENMGDAFDVFDPYEYFLAGYD